MGGSLILFSLVLPTLLWADITNKYIWILVFVTVGFGIIGYVDDRIKMSSENGDGVKARNKFFFQLLIATVAALLMMKWGVDTHLYFPFFKSLKIELGWLYVPFCILVVVGASNAVNLTDGLDGLAIGPSYSFCNFLSSYCLFYRPRGDSQIFTNTLYSRSR